MTDQVAPPTPPEQRIVMRHRVDFGEIDRQGAPPALSQFLTNPRLADADQIIGVDLAGRIARQQ